MTQIPARPPSRRHRRPGRRRQDHADRAALRGRCATAARSRVITNDIYTREDAEALMRLQVLPADRIIGVETGGCPHTAIREDASINLAAVAELRRAIPDLDVVLIESGGDNLSATFSPELADVTIYVIDTAAGRTSRARAGPAITRSDLLVVNKTDLAPHVGVSVDLLRERCGAGAGRPALRHGRAAQRARAWTRSWRISRGLAGWRRRRRRSERAPARIFVTKIRIGNSRNFRA